MGKTGEGTGEGRRVAGSYVCNHSEAESVDAVRVGLLGCAALLMLLPAVLSTTSKKTKPFFRIFRVGHWANIQLAERTRQHTWWYACSPPCFFEAKRKGAEEARGSGVLARFCKRKQTPSQPSSCVLTVVDVEPSRGGRSREEAVVAHGTARPFICLIHRWGQRARWAEGKNAVVSCFGLG
ncbi:unnamed protein product [Ectocarpus sp. 4 AP-2014]